MASYATKPICNLKAWPVAKILLRFCHSICNVMYSVDDLSKVRLKLYLSREKVVDKLDSLLRG